MDQKTGEKYLDDQGREVKGEDIIFLAEESEMNLEMTFTFPGENLRGVTLVVFEDLIHRDVLVAAHRDISSQEQSVDYPDGRTKARDEKTKIGITKAEEKAVVLDEFFYTNLRTGYEYILKGQLVDKKSGKAVAENELKFTPKEKDGSVIIPFEFDSSKLEGGSLVVYETLFYEAIPLIIHQDPDDEDQSIVVPKIRTVAKADGKKTAKPGEKTLLKDVVTYEGLEPERAYILVAEVVDSRNGKILKREYVNVTADDSHGEFLVEIEMNTMEYADRSLVFYETLQTLNEENEVVTVAEHRDIKDKDQTVSIRQPKTPGTGDRADYARYMSLFMAALTVLLLFRKDELERMA